MPELLSTPTPLASPRARHVIRVVEDRCERKRENGEDFYLVTIESSSKEGCDSHAAIAAVMDFVDRKNYFPVALSPIVEDFGRVPATQPGESDKWRKTYRVVRYPV